MTREIKFRAWDKQDGLMIYSSNELYIGLGGMLLGWIADKGEYELMQYTGLHDKNGKEIYHSDIIQRENSKYIVDWDSYQGRWVAKNTAEVPSSFSIIAVLKGGVEIIGSIYENPELLK